LPEKYSTVGIAQGTVEDIRTEQRDILIDPRVHVEDQLVLVIEARRFHQENGPRPVEGKYTAARYLRIKSSWQRRIDVLGLE
jgi:hypothetical protein